MLASASPRRHALLGEAGLRFEIRPSSIEEMARAGELPVAMAERLAREKASDVATRLPDAPRRLVLGADTIVVSGDAVLGKPRDADHAVELLSRLVGTRHRVVTGIACGWSDGRELLSSHVVSHVDMRPAPRGEIEQYVALGESLDKAGGYALQGEGRRFVVGVSGSRSNVIGLPMEETLELLERAGYADEVSPA